MWWLNASEPGKPETKEWPDLPDDIYYAEGHDGQDVVILPSQNMVIVRLSVSRNVSWDMGQFLSDVLAAVEESK
jgi:hypothetical protein